jgi:hypothetical protein
VPTGGIVVEATAGLASLDQARTIAVPGWRGRAERPPERLLKSILRIGEGSALPVDLLRRVRSCSSGLVARPARDDALCSVETCVFSKPPNARTSWGPYKAGAASVVPVRGPRLVTAPASQAGPKSSNINDFSNFCRSKNVP